MSLDMEDEFIGEPSHLVPKVEPSEYCNGKKKMKEDGSVVRNEGGQVLFGGYCKAGAGKGTTITERGDARTMEDALPERREKIRIGRLTP